MKVRIFLFKFIDHDNKKILKVEASVRSSLYIEWTEEENDIEGYVEWMSKHARWEYTLKKEIKKQISQRYFGNTDGKFNDYRISKRKIKKESDMVNMSKNDKEVRFRETMLMEKWVFKYSKGTKPAEWTDVFDYACTHQHIEFFLKGDDSTNEINLTVLADKINIPQEGVKRFNGSDSANARNTASTNMTSANLASARNASTNMASANMASARNASANLASASMASSRNASASNMASARNTTATNRGPAQVMTNSGAVGSVTASNYFAVPYANTAAAAQRGGNENYEEKYLKYKRKYLELRGDY